MKKILHQHLPDKDGENFQVSIIFVTLQKPSHFQQNSDNFEPNGTYQSLLDGCFLLTRELVSHHYLKLKQRFVQQSVLDGCFLLT